MCRTCVAELVVEETSQECTDLFSSVRELTNSLSLVRSLLVKSLASQAGPKQPPSTPRPSTSRAVVSTDSGDEGTNTLPSLKDSDEEEEDSWASRYKLSLEEVDDLLKVIYMTLEIQEERVELSVHDKMYQGLDETKPVFPVHRVFLDAIRKEWKDPERGSFFSKTLRRRVPFEEKETEIWNKKPRVDTVFSLVSHRTELAFKDMGVLKDAMDKRADSLLKKHGISPPAASSL